MEEKSPILVTRGFSNNDNVSCYANSVVQILFHCELLATKIRNDQLGPILKHTLQQYSNENIELNTTSIRSYLTNDFQVYGGIYMKKGLKSSQSVEFTCSPY